MSVTRSSCSVNFMGIAMASKALTEMTDAELVAERDHWDRIIANATGWGGGLGAANEFRTECERELRRRDAASSLMLRGIEAKMERAAQGEVIEHKGRRYVRRDGHWWTEAWVGSGAFTARVMDPDLRIDLYLIASGALTFPDHPVVLPEAPLVFDDSEHYREDHLADALRYKEGPFIRPSSWAENMLMIIVFGTLFFMILGATLEVLGW